MRGRGFSQDLCVADVAPKHRQFLFFFSFLNFVYFLFSFFLFLPFFSSVAFCPDEGMQPSCSPKSGQACDS